MTGTSYGALGVDDHPKKKNTVITALGVILVIVGFILIAIGSLQFKTTKDETMKKSKDRVGVVIDAGGSGTRLIIYSYSNKKMKQLYYHSCEDEGMAKYSEDEFPKLKNLLANCIEDAVKKQNLTANKKVPIYFGATAGMRLLKHTDLTMYNKVWNLVEGVVDESPLKAEKINTISGYEEAEWAWIAANYLKKTFQHHKKLYGTTELGSSSAQIAFPAPKESLSKYDDVQMVDIDGEKIILYGHSYLCFGKNEMERHHLAKMTQESNYSHVVKTPCFFKGFNKTVTSEYLWKPPCVSGKYAKQVFGEDINGPKGEFVIQGTGDYEDCSAQINRAVNTNCTKTSCGINNVFQPPVHGTFLALSSFYYTAEFLDISLTAGEDEFQKAATKYCAKTWDELKKEGKTEPVKYMHGMCFGASYTNVLLTKGFKFDRNTWHLEFTKKIDGTYAQWTLGLMYKQRKTMYQRFTDVVVKITVERASWIAMIVIGCIVVIIGVVLSMLGRRRGDKSGYTKTGA